VRFLSTFCVIMTIFDFLYSHKYSLEFVTYIFLWIFCRWLKFRRKMSLDCDFVSNTYELSLFYDSLKLKFVIFLEISSLARKDLWSFVISSSKCVIFFVIFILKLMIFFVISNFKFTIFFVISSLTFQIYFMISSLKFAIFFVISNRM